MKMITALVTAGALACSASAFSAGTWTTIAAAAPFPNAGSAILLSDGTVIVCSDDAGSDGVGKRWCRLTPDIHGSYAAGTWSTIASMIDTRLYYSSQLLKDGRFYIAGGEYGTGGSKGEVYNPLTNTWTATGSPGSTLSDANSEILPDGRVLQALVSGNLRGTKIWDPGTNAFSTGPTCVGIHNESTWIKLADESILMVDRGAQTSERWIAATNTWVADANVPVALYDPFGLETGGAALLPDGRSFWVGSLGTTAFYTPSGTAAPGNWVAGPSLPDNQGQPDAAVAMMVNGKVLLVTSPVPVSGNVFPSPTSFYEFNPATLAYTRLNAPTGGLTANDPAYVWTLLCLPNGGVLLTRQGSTAYWIYTPDGTPEASGKPAISTAIRTSATGWTLSGTKFNGISEGAVYGDDFQMNTNYPVVRMVNSATGNVYYARTFNWNRTGVMTGAALTTTQMTVPAGLPLGIYSLVVTANGIASDPITLAYTANGCQEDLNSDGVVDGADLGLLLAAWGQTGLGDLNADGVVDGADLGLLLANWGPC